MNDTKYWLWLALVFGNSGSRLWRVMNAFETSYEAYHELCSDYELYELTEREKNNIKSTSLHHAEEIIGECHKKGIGIISYSSEKYPSKVRYIFNPPAVLYYKGNIDCLNGTKTVTTVGTRRANNYSLYTADRICSELAEKGVIIVSGFAVGIDIRTHLAAVSKNMPTICVLGCGIDVNYPAENFQYRDMILNAGGVFISEFHMGTRAFGDNFPRRNRILAALGNATIVFQAPITSGSLITADLAAEQGKEIFCIPPANIFSYDYSGNTELLRSGAIPLFSANDILAYFDIEQPALPDEWAEEAAKRKRKNYFGKSDKLKKSVETNNETNEKISQNEKNEKNENYEKEKVSQNKKIEDLPEFDGVQNDIMKILSGGAVHIDVIANELDIDLTELMTALTELEIIGAVNSLPGKMFEIKS